MSAEEGGLEIMLASESRPGGCPGWLRQTRVRSAQVLTPLSPAQFPRTAQAAVRQHARTRFTVSCWSSEGFEDAAYPPWRAVATFAVRSVEYCTLLTQPPQRCINAALPITHSREDCLTFLGRTASTQSLGSESAPISQPCTGSLPRPAWRPSTVRKV